MMVYCSKNFLETKKLHNITDAEQELLASKKSGDTLVMIGPKRLNVILRFMDISLSMYMGSVTG